MTDHDPEAHPFGGITSWRPTVTDWVDTVFAECGNGCMRSGIDGWLYPSTMCCQHWPLGTCAGPSWEAHEPFKVATGNPCPRCGTVMVDVPKLEEL